MQSESKTKTGITECPIMIALWALPEVRKETDVKNWIKFNKISVFQQRIYSDYKYFVDRVAAICDLI